MAESNSSTTVPGTKDAVRAKSDRALMSLPLNLIDANPAQPRKTFSSRQLEELAESIRAAGLIQPIVVRPVDGGRYQIVAGERRYRAFELLAASDDAYQTIPAVVSSRDDKQTQVAALIENVVRENLNPIERAQALRELRDHLGIRSYEDVATKVGLSRRAVYYYVGLLKLKKEYQQAITEGKPTEKHGRALAKLGKRESSVDLFEYLLQHPDVNGDKAIEIATVLTKTPGFTAEEAHKYLDDPECSAKLPKPRTGPPARPEMQVVRGLKTFLKSMDDIEPGEVDERERGQILELLELAETAVQNLRNAWDA